MRWLIVSGYLASMTGWYIVASRPRLLARSRRPGPDCPETEDI